MKIAIIGAGITGITTAYYLAKDGYEVDIFDEELGPAMACSRMNGGQLSSCNSETWHTWNNVVNGVLWLLRKDAPLKIGLKPTPLKIMWLAGFLYHTIINSHNSFSRKTALMALEASNLYKQIMEEENINFNDFSASESQMLHVYTSDTDFKKASKSKKLFDSVGVDWISMSPTEITSSFVNLEYFRNLKGGYLTKHDWVGDARQFSIKLLSILKEKYHVNAIFNSKILDAWITKDNDVSIISDKMKEYRYDAVVVCAGHASAKIALNNFDPMLIYPVKGYSISVIDQDFSNSYGWAPRISLLDNSKKIVSSHLGSFLRVAGTAELDGNNKTIYDHRLIPLKNWVMDNFNVRKLLISDEWACLRPMTPSMMPIVKRSRVGNIFYNTGHGHLGWTLAPTTAKHVALMIDYMLK